MAGRPRKDDINTQQLIINLVKTGMTNTAIAEITGLHRDTIQKWLARTELGETVKATRQASVMLEASQKHALNKSALIAAKKLLKKRKVEEYEERRDTEGKLLYTQKRIKETEPNAGIVQFILKCTDPQNWNEQQVIEQATAETAEKADNEIRIVIDDDTQQ
jgi:transposase